MLAAAARVCEGSKWDVWAVTNSGEDTRPYMIRAAHTLGPALEDKDLSLLPIKEGGVVARRSVEALAILYSRTWYALLFLALELPLNLFFLF